MRVTTANLIPNDRDSKRRTTLMCHEAVLYYAMQREARLLATPLQADRLVLNITSHAAEVS